MTRKGLNKILIEAVKKSVTLDNHRFPSLKTFAEIRGIYDVNSTTLEKNALYTPGSDFFYSTKAEATGEGLAVDFPALFLIELEGEFNMPFTFGSKEWIYDLSLLVVYPIGDERLYQKKPIIHKEEVTKFCKVHLDWVINYIANSLKESGDTRLIKRLNTLNPVIKVYLNENQNGNGVAWANIRFPECVEYDFQKNTRTTFCCGHNKPDQVGSSENFVVDDTGETVVDDTLQFITLD